MVTRTGDREIGVVSGRLPDNTGELACMKLSRKKNFQDFNRIWAHGLCSSTEAMGLNHVEVLNFFFHVNLQLLKLQLQSTLALRTPRYNGHPDNTDSS